jgi:hypothetical protein
MGNGTERWERETEQQIKREREWALVRNCFSVGQKWPLVKSTPEYFYLCKSIRQTTVNQD